MFFSLSVNYNENNSPYGCEDPASLRWLYLLNRFYVNTGAFELILLGHSMEAILLTKAVIMKTIKKVVLFFGFFRKVFQVFLKFCGTLPAHCSWYRKVWLALRYTSFFYCCQGIAFVVSVNFACNCSWNCGK